MVLAGYTSFEDWVVLQRAEPFYAVLCGFDPDDPAGVGTYYDFCNRLLGGAPQPGRRPARRLTKARKRQLREDKRRPSGQHPGLVSRLARVLRTGGRKAQHWKPRAVERLVNGLLDAVCVAPAVRTGLLPAQLGVSGDGTKLATFANSYGKKVCACPGRGCPCPRQFSDGEASTGYDAYHHQYVFGHNLYELTGWSLAGGPELPVYLLRATGARSDALLGPLALARVQEYGTVRIQHACFDGAHDAAGFYQLGQDWQIALIIPLVENPSREGARPEGAEQPAADGTPICQAGKRMYPTGFQAERQRQQWRCPLIKGPERGDVTTCPYQATCSTAPSGRVVYTYVGQDPRRNTVPPRGTDAWQKLYNHRTASERSFACQKEQLGLAQTRTRGGARWLFRALLTAMAQYALAWHRYQPTT
jgi:hypothetical protein